MRRNAIIVCALAVLTASLPALPDSASAQPTTIDVGDLYFCAPSFQNGVCETTVTAGSTVTWSVSFGFHTVTECDASYSTCPPTGGFNSDQVQTGDTFSQTFDTPGSIAYRCNFHPTEMRGLIVVEAQQTAAPTATPVQAPTTAPPPQPTAINHAPPPTSTPGGVPTAGGEAGGGSQLAVILLALGSLSLVSGAFSLVLLRRKSA